MKISNISFQQTGYFSKTICDYISEAPSLKAFYNRFPKIENFKVQIAEKKNSETVNQQNRAILVSVLQKQYANLEASGETIKNISALALENTFTVTTGHQLNLFSGPLYFIYKIVSTLNLCETLAERFPNENFVPVYWMATEDHDFEEINYFNFKDKKVQWHSQQSGAVGRFATEGLDEVFKQFSKHLGNSTKAIELKELFIEAYLNHDCLASATRYLVNELFKDYGLVIMDADDKELKSLFLPFIEKELFENRAFHDVSKTISSLKEDYKIQVNPRNINLFYIEEGIRERIIFDGEQFKINNSQKSFSKLAMQQELKAHPEKFSPNVIMRPLYQEVILPNLCYIGGGGELAYWLELKAYFDNVGVVFPMLLLRNSVQVISEKQFKKLEKNQITLTETFLRKQALITKKVKEFSQLNVDFSTQKEFLKDQFKALREVAQQTDVSFTGAVNAQERKQIKGLENLEKRLLKAEKRKQKELVATITKIKDELFPNESLEERYRNFSEYYLEYGDEFIQILKEHLKPLELTFSVLVL